jgi:hypothetical protein
VRRQGLEPRTRGLRVRCSVYPHVHRRTPAQVTVVCIPPWTVLDSGELQLKLQLSLALAGAADVGGVMAPAESGSQLDADCPPRRVRRSTSSSLAAGPPAVPHERGHPPARLDPGKPDPFPQHQLIEFIPPAIQAYADASGHHTVICWSAHLRIIGRWPRLRLRPSHRTVTKCCCSTTSRPISRRCSSMTPAAAAGTCSRTG